MDKKRLYGGVIIISLMVTMVLAAWLLQGSITGAAVYKVKSQKDNVTIIRNFNGSILNTQNSSANYTDSFIVDSVTNMKVQLAISDVRIDNESDSCTDYLNDCQLSYFYGDYSGYGIFPPITQIYNGDTITLAKGENQFHIYVECKLMSCEQELQSVILLTPKKE